MGKSREKGGNISGGINAGMRKLAILVNIAKTLKKQICYK
jgi:hypothetical protein